MLAPPLTRRSRPKASEATLNAACRDRLDALLGDLAGVGPLHPVRVDLPGSEASYWILQPSDFDALLDAAQSDPEQNLPYWAELWPSGIGLAAAIARNPGVVSGKRVLELGCGLGVTAIAALKAGADLVVTDYAAEALALCALNATAMTGHVPRGLRMNWRAGTAELRGAAGEGFAVVLAADVLYEARDVEPLLALVPRLVAPGGELWLAEPGRAPAARFLAALDAGGWVDECDQCRGPWPDPEDNQKGVVVTIHRLRQRAD